MQRNGRYPGKRTLRNLVAALLCLLPYSTNRARGAEGAGREEARGSAVEVELSASQEKLQLGVTWDLYATVRNLSDFPIWISDSYSLLVLPPALRPRSENKMKSQSGQFPEPTRSWDTEYLKIGPREAKRVFWRITWDEGDDGTSTDPYLEALQSIADATSSDATGLLAENTSSPLSRQPPLDAARVGERSWLNSLGKWWERFRRRTLEFQPGRYEAKVAIHYWTQVPAAPAPQTPADFDQDLAANVLEGMIFTANQPPTETSNTILASREINVLVSPMVTMLGGALGGLLGFFLLFLSEITSKENHAHKSQRTVSGMVGSWFIYGAHAVLAILLGVIVTILASRLGQTDFLFSITINDIWGAIIVGLAAELAGVRVLEKALGINIRHGLEFPTGPTSTTQHGPEKGALDNPAKTAG